MMNYSYDGCEKRNTSILRSGAYLLIMMLMVSFSACSVLGGDDDEEEIEPLEYSFYSGYWEVDTNPVTAAGKEAAEGSQNGTEALPVQAKGKSNGYDLRFYQLDGWDHSFLVTNENEERELKFGDDPLLFTFAVANYGSETFSVYLNASSEAVITLKWDGVEYELHKMLQLQAGYYEWNTIAVENFYGDLDLSPGSHTAELILDVPGQSPKTISRTIDIAAPDIMADTFEFTESKYFIEYNGEVSHGNLSFNNSNNTLTLHGYGTLEIVEDNGSELIASVSLEGMYKEGETASSPEILIGMQKQNPRVQDSPMVNLLSHDPWTLVSTTSTNTSAGQEWMFHRSGHYDFINNDAGFTRKAWGYDSETSINYGFTHSALNGTTEILELTHTRMVMDDGANTFEFSR